MTPDQNKNKAEELTNLSPNIGSAYKVAIISTGSDSERAISLYNCFACQFKLVLMMPVLMSSFPCQGMPVFYSFLPKISIKVIAVKISKWQIILKFVAINLCKN